MWSTVFRNNGAIWKCNGCIGRPECWVIEMRKWEHKLCGYKILRDVGKCWCHQELKIQKPYNDIVTIYKAIVIWTNLLMKRSFQLHSIKMTDNELSQKLPLRGLTSVCRDAIKEWVPIPTLELQCSTGLKFAQARRLRKCLYWLVRTEALIYPKLREFESVGG
jgi:hypothetical protein